MKRLLFVLLSCIGLSVSAQDVAVKSNLLYDAALNINGGVEFGVAPKWTVDVTANYNNWTFSEGKRWKNWFLQPEARYWFCDRFAGHFLGFHLHGGKYNMGGIKGGFNLLGSDLSKPVSRLVCRRRCRLWLLLYPRHALESGVGDRHRICLYQIRPLRMHRLRRTARDGQNPPLCRTHKGSRQLDLRILKPELL